MFWLGKAIKQEVNKSPKQIYEEKLEKMRAEAVNNWEYTYKEKYEEYRTLDEYLSLIITKKRTILAWRFNNKLLWYFKISEEEVNKWYKSLIVDRHNEMEIQKQKAEAMELQRKEDEEYREKLRKLLEIKPLDEDLKKNFKKAERLLEIAEEYKALEKEMFELRK